MIVVAIEAEGVGQTVGPFASVPDAEAWIMEGWGEYPTDEATVRIIESPTIEDQVDLIAPT